jgi:tetratricopeptide (TPR) repeat protein
MTVELMKALPVQIVLLSCVLLCAPVLAQPTGSLESVLAIESPAERLAALQKFLRTNSIPDQAQAAREAIVNIHAQLGEAQLGENNIQRATEEFRRALDSLPDKISDRFFEDTVVRIPLAVSVRGYRNEAAALTRPLEKRFAKEPQRLARLGEFFLTIEAPNDAIRALEAASSQSDENATLHRALGAAYRMGLRLDDAVAEYQQAIRVNAQDKRAYYELGNLYRAHGAYDDAVKLYRKQIETEPKHTPSHKGLAMALLALGKDDDAQAALNQARDIRGSLEEITGDIYLQTQLAFHHLSRGKLKEARQAADSALAVEPRYAWARIAAAEVDMAEGKYFDGERHLLAAKNYASFPTLFFTLGKLYLAVEDFDGAQEQFAKAFSYSARKQFSTLLGGTIEVQADNLKDLLSREHQASLFLAEAPTTAEQFKIAESLVKFNTRLRMLKAPPPVNRPVRTPPKAGAPPPSEPEPRRKQMEELDQAALGFVEAENVRRSFRMLYIATQLAEAGVATGLAIELADQALGLAEVATDADGSLREYPNFDRNGRLRIFRGRALDARGWALFKANQLQDAAAALNDAVQAYGTLPEGGRAMRHLAAVREAQGEWKDALDLYIAAYEPAENAGRDLNRAVIESLYRKVNGSLDGLDKRIGPALVAVTPAAAAPPAVKPPETKTGRPPAGPNAGLNPGREPLLKPSGSASPAETEKPGAKATGKLLSPVQKTRAEVGTPVENPTVATASTEPTPILRKPFERKPIELPASSNAAVPIVPAPNLDPHTLSSPRPATDDSIPPPPVHTRKRRVTAPN